MRYSNNNNEIYTMTLILFFVYIKNHKSNYFLKSMKVSLGD